MANFKLCAFADEYSANIDEQIEGLHANGIEYVELRNVDGTNVSEITLDKAREVRSKFDAAGIKVWSIGSPIGKIDLTDDIAQHIKTLENTIEVAKILDCDKIRMFSFFIPHDADKTALFDEVKSRLSLMLDVAEQHNIILCHENEKGIFGDTVDSCAKLRDFFGDRLKIVFDPANYCQVGEETYPHGYSVLGDDIFYMHIKDAFISDGRVVPAGFGDGHVPEILAEINKRVKGDFILTLEPHLKVFDGLTGLEKADGRTKIKDSYSGAAEAFKTAADALKAILSKL